jgi:hypothetical protein
MAVDVEVFVVKLFNHFSSSVKRTAALKLVLAFLNNGEEHSKSRDHAMAKASSCHRSTRTKLTCY